MVPGYWTDWPLSERDAGKDGNVVFFEKFWSRDEHHRSRVTPGSWLSGIAATPYNVWTEPAWPRDTFYVPPWAERLVMRFHLALTCATGPYDLGIVQVRPRIGTLIGSSAWIFIADPYIWQDFWVPVDGDHRTSQGVLFLKESVIQVTDAERGTEQPFFYEIRAGSAPPLTTEVANDVNHATKGDRYRHWYWVEAER